jgi:hypothetical protein
VFTMLNSLCFSDLCSSVTNLARDTFTTTLSRWSLLLKSLYPLPCLFWYWLLSRMSLLGIPLYSLLFSLMQAPWKQRACLQFILGIWSSA